MYRDGVCSRRTARFLIESWKPATQKCYDSYINKWSTFCLIKGIDRLTASEMQVCDFIREMSEAGYSYGAVNTARCALSVVLPKRQDGSTMGKRYWVSRAVRAAYLRNPPKPKYAEFWDIRIVLRCLKSWGSNEDMTLRRLGFKLLLLLLLVTGQRGQVARALSIKEMQEWDDGSVSFILLTPMKTARTGEKLLELHLKPYYRDPALCVVRVLKAYLSKTRRLRKSPLLFVSFRKPHQAVSRDTIARWIVQTMRVSGINTKKYGSHSLRGAGVSAGARMGVSTNLLLKYGSWRNERTMAKHYKKNVEVQPDEGLGRVILDEIQ